ncbi:unnamed protein product [Anisakis simplex]|uniref:Uncharacterized protein n=1 Tax=Anisakis simplex TaxID=6269 RepID=A0A3P6PRV6_ANISI|nr:unnamed protein product [Anisakis simplex]
MNKLKKDRSEAVSAPVNATHLPKQKVYGSGVGKYLNLEEFIPTVAQKRIKDTSDTGQEEAVFGTAAVQVKKKKKAVRSELKDFSKW